MGGGGVGCVTANLRAGGRHGHGLRAGGGRSHGRGEGVGSAHGSRHGSRARALLGPKCEDIVNGVASGAACAELQPASGAGAVGGGGVGCVTANLRASGGHGHGCREGVGSAYGSSGGGARRVCNDGAASLLAARRTSHFAGVATTTTVSWASLAEFSLLAW